MPHTTPAIPDPRTYPDRASAPAAARALYALAEAALAAETRQLSDAADRALQAALATRLAGDGAALAAIVNGAPSVVVARCLWRALDAVWREVPASEGDALAVAIFALPVVIVAGAEGTGDAGVLPGVLAEPAKLAAILGEFGALGGNRTFALASALVAADAIDIARLPEIATWRRLPDSAAPALAPSGRALAPAPIPFRAATEAAHLRFVVGTAIARRDADLLADGNVGKWGVPFARELGRQLGTAGATVLALPRAPQRLLPAVAQGRAAQRDVAAQLFASNAIRRFRGTSGEPTAIISAHRSPDAPGGGELRLSLSSALDPRGAEGFRCPIYSPERVGDVASMLVDLLRDCSINDIRALAGIHPDRVAGTGLPLLFKPDTIAECEAHVMQ